MTTLTADVTATFYDYGEVLFTMNSREAAQTWADTIGFGLRSNEEPREGSSYLTESRFSNDLIVRALKADLTVVRQEIKEGWRLVSETPVTLADYPSRGRGRPPAETPKVRKSAWYSQDVWAGVQADPRTPDDIMRAGLTVKP